MIGEYEIMTPERQIQPIPGAAKEQADLRSQLEDARIALLEAEAELAEEQAAVNAFRMHCRLKLNEWINRLLDLQAERQAMLTQLELLRQAQDYGIPFDAEDPFWLGDDIDGLKGNEEEDEEELILPTDVPRDKEAEKRLYRELARRFHPDLGVTAVEIAYRTEMMTAVNTAYSTGDVQTLYDLADELDPNEAAELSSISSAEIRKLRQQLNRLRQRRRKAQRRLATLREENTARLWQKARHLEQDDIHWWEVVRREIERAITRVEGDNDHLSHQLHKLQERKNNTSTTGLI